jgi:hypothetical protein
MAEAAAALTARLVAIAAVAVLPACAQPPARCRI